MSTPDTAEVWFLTGSQGLYGPETLDQVAAQSQRIAEVLDGADQVGIRVVWKPVLTSADAIRRIALEANSADGCIGIVAWMHTFSPAKMWIAGMDILRKPLLHLHTQAGEALPWADIDMDFMNLNQAAHGDREFGYIQSRLGVARKTVAGFVEHTDVLDSVGAWVRASRGAAKVRTLKLARFGDNMRDVAVTEGDKVEAQRKFGVSVNTYGVNDLVAVVDQVSEADIDSLVAEYDDQYSMAAALKSDGAQRESLREAARIELGLRQFLTAGAFGAFTTNFEDLGGLKQLPGLAVQRLMADGYGFGGEGDWKTSVMLATIKAMGAGRPGGSSFMEDYTYHLVPGEEKILGAHMLEVCPTITSAIPSCEIHPLGIGGRQDPVRLVFNADAGAAVIVGIADMGDRFRLVLNTADVVAPDAPLPKLPVARAVWQPEPNFRTSTEAWLTAGGPHHTVLSTGVGLEEITDFAEIMRTELLVIDSGTKMRDFVNEIRWNQAYYRLAQGF